MNGLLRSWSFCRVSLDPRAPAHWTKTRRKRIWLLLIPGNLLLRLLGTGYRVCGNDWANYETRIFNLAHPGLESAIAVDSKTISLPHLHGITVSQLREKSLREASVAAFMELGRFHRTTERMIHGDPHAGNFLYDSSHRRCRIIDFETAPLESSNPRLGRAMDYAILAMNLVRMDRGLQSAEVRNEWSAAYGKDDAYCPARDLMASPPMRLRFYWWLLGLPQITCQEF